jgi:RimJ/RimL family protein N-acetyltransferase
VSLEPLYGLRVRTPRLELRLPDEDELVELFRLAEAGIHPPEEMPFAVAWTDDLNQESFLAHHRSLRDGWEPAAWTLELGTWEDGQLVGTQGIHAKRFASEHVVGTGSWIGRAHQGRGVGTEMRTAVVELAFRHLGAEAVTSAVFAANTASRRVSEKLGYTVTGRDTMSPRGVPQPHLQVRLDRADWAGAPFAVEVEGLEPCLPLFGAG